MTVCVHSIKIQTNQSDNHSYLSLPISMLDVQLVVDSIDPTSTGVRIITLEPIRLYNADRLAHGSYLQVSSSPSIYKKVLVCLSVSSKLCYRRGRPNRSNTAAKIPHIPLNLQLRSNPVIYMQLSSTRFHMCRASIRSSPLAWTSLTLLSYSSSSSSFSSGLCSSSFSSSSSEHSLLQS
jgi:hypothetical protein